MRAALLPLFALATAFAACSSDDSRRIPSSGGGTTLDPATFCDAYAGAICAATDSCGCPTLDDAPSCLERNVASCKASLAPVFGAIALGDLEFDSVQAASCIDDAAETLTACVRPTTRNRPDSCNGWLRDKAPLGGTCSQFGAGLLCADGAGACVSGKGACVPLPSEGKSCIGPRCAVGLVCDAGLCRSPQTAGSACTVDDACETAFVCLDGFCAVPRGAGGACSVATECAEGLGCSGGTCVPAVPEGVGCTGEACGAEAVCRDTPGLKSCAPQAKAGEPCEAFGDCETGTECDYSAAKPVCVTIAALGEACPLGSCASGASCLSGVCIATPQAGEPCAYGSSKPCADRTGCVAGTCTTGAQPGAACVGDENACAIGASCDFSAMPLTCKAVGGLGASCNNDDAFCDDGLHCDTSKGMCAGPVALGEGCTSPRACGPGAYCEFGQQGGVCATLPSEPGKSCAFECATGLRCTGPTGVCAKGACVLR